MDWDTSFPAVKYSNILTVVALALVTLIPVLLTTLYCKNFKKLSQKNMKSSYDAGLIGTKKDSLDRARLLHPIIFFVRRFTFVLSVIFLQDYIIFQLNIQMMFAVLTFSYISHSWPLDSPFANRMELLNESTVLILSYLLWGFTDLEPRPEIRFKIGLIYVTVTVLNIAVHQIFLIISTV